MASLGSLVVSLIAETGRFRDDLNRASTIAQRNFKSIENAAKTAAAAIGVGFGAAGASGIFRAMINEQEEVQRTLLRTNAILQATGNSIGRGVGELIGQAEELNRTTLIAEEEIRRGQQILLSYTGIVGTNFDRALTISTDLASLMGTSLPSAVETFAKALESPVERISALTRIGFNFTEQQKEQIKTLVESNKLFEAQNIILDVAQRSFGGLAQREAQGFAGAQKALSEAVKDSALQFSEQLGLMEKTESGMRALASAISESTAFIIENKTALAAWAGVITGGALLAALPALVIGVKALAAAFVALAAAAAATAAAFLANPIALAILGITAAAIPAINYVNSLSKEVKGLTISASENNAEMRKLARQQSVALGTFQQVTTAVKDNKKEQEKIAGILQSQREAYQSLFLTKAQMVELDLRALGATQQQITDFRTLTNAIEGYNLQQDRARATSESYMSLLDEFRSLYDESASAIQKVADREAYLLNLQERLIAAGYERATVERLIGEAILNNSEQVDNNNKKAKEGIDVYKQFGSAISTSFEDAIINGRKFSDVLKALEQDIIRIILRQTVTASIENFITGALKGAGGGGGAGGFIGNVLGSLFGGARAVGGPVMPNRAYLVGERGPELFMPASAGNIKPSMQGAGAGINVVNNFIVSGPVDRRSQMQIAAAAGQGIQKAVGRNT